MAPDDPHEEAPPPPSPPQPKPPGPFERAPVTLGLTVIWAAVFLIAEWQGDTQSTDTLLTFGALERSHVWEGQWWRLLTASFLHIGWIHFLWNGFFMIRLCGEVERGLGSQRLIAVYLGTALTASAVSLLGQDALSAGASGVGFGLIGLITAIGARRHPRLSDIPKDPQVRSTLIMLVIWTAIGTQAGWDNYAHIGGFFFGALYGVTLRRVGGPAPWGRRILTGLASLAVVVAALVPQGETRWSLRLRADEVEAAFRAGDCARALELVDVPMPDYARRWQGAVRYEALVCLGRDGEAEVYREQLEAAPEGE